MTTQLFADRLAEYGIPVFEVRPGIILTDMTAPVQEKYQHLIEGGIRPEDVAKTANADGGFHIRRL